MIEFWMQLWKICLIGALGLFAGLAICVTIGGVFDIRQLFKKLRELDDDAN